MLEAPRDIQIERSRIFNTAMASIAGQIASGNGRRPVLFGPNGKPLPPRLGASPYAYSRKSAQRTGTMTNWIPKRLYDPRTQAMERERIVERCIELVQDNPYAAGIKDTFATTVIGPGLIPQPEIDCEALSINQKQARTIRSQMRSIWRKWSPWADAGGRMTIGGIQFLLECNDFQYGEHIILPLQLNGPGRPYALALQVISPMRLKTPSDKYKDGNICDGVELDKNGAPKAYWIKKSTIGKYLSDNSTNFERIPAWNGHRRQVIHQFINDDAEQVRGMPKCAPALKFFLDLNDLLDAELVSSIVTAAMSMFIVTAAGDPYDWANNTSGWNDSGTNRSSGVADKTVRYQEMIPGGVMYGSAGQKPHLLSANRPGTTFDPFTQIILKAISSAIGIPYVAMFKDLKGVSFAGFRGAMLEAWRTYMFRRTYTGQNTLTPIRAMLLEEAYLRRELKVSDFYTNMDAYTAASWQGYPKGDIEPVKAASADITLNQNHMKTLETIASERGTTVEALIEQLAEEKEMKIAAGLISESLVSISSEQPGKNEESGEEEQEEEIENEE